MIGTIISLITGNPLARFVAKMAGIALAVLTFGAWQRRQGAQAAKAKQNKAALDATIKGAEAARKGRAEAADKLRKGMTPEEIRRANDGDWS